MGLDFIRSKSGRPHIKRWAYNLDRFKTPSLFETKLNQECRTVTVALNPEVETKPGDICLLHSGPLGRLEAFKGITKVGSIDSPPSALKQLVASSYGGVLATVENIGALGATAELKLNAP